MRVLFISSNRVGDAVLSTGLLAHIIEQHPEARFTIAAGPVSAPLFGGVPGLEKIILFKKRKHSLHWLDLWRKTVLQRWDMIIDLRRSAISYTLCGKRKFIQPKSDAPIHRIALLAATLGLDNNPPSPKIWTNPAHEQLADKLMPREGPVLAIGPTANWGGKMWPADNFVSLIDRLTSEGAPLNNAKVAVFGAPNERLQANPVLKAVPRDRRIDLVGKVDLLTAAACMRKCALYVGNDSGLMHMAAAVGIPTLGLFGPSPDVHYSPWGEKTAFVRTDESFEEIISAPDYDYLSQESRMTSLSVDRAEQAARTLLARCEVERHNG
ncbi:glycosyltransferase family 9 protein [Aestuariispira ectoiniformans]|uniref:glycosyltransferase family 9 protein n=1 Tax=Aestuariispira ectoiniformans TaxID=2775080 RepID=UPI00223A9923|nr:glycosyltransferase family 9 protein [Aestuariispira ectoiniformans]